MQLTSHRIDSIKIIKMTTSQNRWNLNSTSPFLPNPFTVSSSSTPSPFSPIINKTTPSSLLFNNNSPSITNANGTTISLHRNLNQLVDEGQRSAYKNKSELIQDVNQLSAFTFFNSNGIDIKRIQDQFQQIDYTLQQKPTVDSTKTVQTDQQTSKFGTDVHEYLKKEREKALLTMLRTIEDRTYDEINTNSSNTLLNNWHKQRNTILSSLMKHNKNYLEDVSTVQVKRFETPRTLARGLTNLEAAYAKVIALYNVSNTKEIQPRQSLLDEFNHVVESSDQQIAVELWNTVRSMTQFSAQIQQEYIHNRSTLPVQRALVYQARNYLERAFRIQLSKLFINLVSNDDLHKPGSVYKLVIRYIRQKHPQIIHTIDEDGSVDDLPIWSILFYCLRAGDLQSALSTAKRCHLSNAIEWLTNYIKNDGTLDLIMRDKVRDVYERQHLNSTGTTNPFKRLVLWLYLTKDKVRFVKFSAVLSLISAYDINNRHEQIITTLDDLLWLRLAQIVFQQDQQSHVQARSTLSQEKEGLTLTMLQKLVFNEGGENRALFSEKPVQYVFSLLLTGQFEAALDLLNQIDTLKSHSVHIAIYLQENRLLSITSNLDSPMYPVNHEPLKSLNYFRLILNYTEKFRDSELWQTLNYYYLLKDLRQMNNSNSSENCFIITLGNLIKNETTNNLMERIFGINTNGVEKDSRMLDHLGVDSGVVTSNVALYLEKCGHLEKAALLYDRAKKLKHACLIYNRLLFESIRSLLSSTPSSESSMISCARSFATRLSNQSPNDIDQNCTALFTLLDICSYIQFYKSEQYEMAYKIIQQLTLLPFSHQQLDKCVEAMNYYSNEVAECYPDLILITLKIMAHLADNSSSSNLISTTSFDQKSQILSGHKQFSDELKRQADIIFRFIGVLTFKFHNNVHAQLMECFSRIKMA
ncbi:unnamed protein product [Didymodactylos carnosus]|uniref:Nuclear pore protein n=1 Tax=Didymodactylos carnosus TaxID=1234261 RepID=A0A813ZED5_9BILA|nr:unnamed protein product [Didymodactylos carnosus]CAF0897279.1 unnamed protein product [Didymodactylos carnosus]CAF3546699.1 unnamed protein product [Didymodactylos carnosus]CAF3680347.1 unnamed protein product [Didymodactylos carnosus]